MRKVLTLVASLLFFCIASPVSASEDEFPDFEGIFDVSEIDNNATVWGTQTTEETTTIPGQEAGGDSSPGQLPDSPDNASPGLPSAPQDAAPFTIPIAGTAPAFYCIVSGGLDPDCLAVAPSNCMPSTILGLMAGSDSVEETLAYCLDEDEDSAPAEATTPTLETETVPSPAIPPEELVYAAVTEEFAALHIDGGTVAFEPDLLGYGLIDRHTNIFAEVASQTRTSQILGYDVDIRVTPVDYQFDYGDGSTLTTSNPGSSLHPGAVASGEVNVTDTATPTSHVYTNTGVYPVSVTTTFIGEYQVAGSGWIAIPGTATADATPGEADIWRINTALVSGECGSTADFGCNGPVNLTGDDRPPEIFADQYDADGNWLGSR